MIPSDVTVKFYDGSHVVALYNSSLEAFDASKHEIPLEVSTYIIAYFIKRREFPLIEMSVQINHVKDDNK